MFPASSSKSQHNKEVAAGITEEIQCDLGHDKNNVKKNWQNNTLLLYYNCLLVAVKRKYEYLRRTVKEGLFGFS